MKYAISIIDSATTKGLGESPSSGGYEVAKHLKVMGVDVGQVGQRLYSVEQHVEAAEKENTTCLGGDHLATYGLFQGALTRENIAKASMVVIDAHDDCGAFHDGGVDASNWLGSLMHDDKIDQWVPLGLRTMNKDRFSGTVEDAVDCVRKGPTYISIDMDGFDPSIAPGVNWPVPNGLMAHTVLDLLVTIANDNRLRRNVIGFDVCEYVPSYDAGKITASLAAHCVMAYANGDAPTKQS